jgi:hypothetical protein
MTSKCVLVQERRVRTRLSFGYKKEQRNFNQMEVKQMSENSNALWKAFIDSTPEGFEEAFYTVVEDLDEDRLPDPELLAKGFLCAINVGVRYMGVLNTRVLYLLRKREDGGRSYMERCVKYGEFVKAHQLCDKQHARVSV